MRVRLCTLSEAERVARIRTQSRERKRAERDRRRDARRPDPAVLDRAIADALRSYLTRIDRPLTRPIDPVALLKTVRDHLLLRNLRLEKEGREPIIYDPQQVVDALKERLLTPVESGRAA